jgi:hypothetical protein
VVYYPAEGGEPKAMILGKKCADLWVAPDASMIAFIGIDETRKPGREALFNGE